MHEFGVGLQPPTGEVQVVLKHPRTFAPTNGANAANGSCIRQMVKAE